MTQEHVKLIVRLDLGAAGRMGPGKLELLERIQELGSISAAARTMKMSYRQAWDLVQQMNEAFKEPVVTSQTGGRHGGGAILTEFGKSLLAHLAAIRREAEQAAQRHLNAVESNLRRGAQPKPNDDDTRQ